MTPGAAATPAEFVAAHGDGPGYVVTGFGCDGRAFNIDAVRGVGQTWDFEGMTLATAITASAPQVPAGQDVVISGHVTDAAGRVTGDPVVLQARTPGQGEWRAVSELTLVGPDGWSRVTVDGHRGHRVPLVPSRGRVRRRGLQRVGRRARGPGAGSPAGPRPRSDAPSPEQQQTTPAG